MFVVLKVDRGHVTEKGLRLPKTSKYCSCPCIGGIREPQRPKTNMNVQFGAGEEDRSGQKRSTTPKNNSRSVDRKSERTTPENERVVE